MKTEWLDIYDRFGNRTGRMHDRSLPFSKDEFFLQVSVWVIDKSGNCLFTKRVPDKKYHPNCWEVTGGFAMAGEDGFDAARRELQEETGLIPDKKLWRFLGKRKYENFFSGRSYFHEVYIVHLEEERPLVKYLADEVAASLWISLNDIPAFIAENNMEPFTPESYKIYKEHIVTGA